MKRITVVAGIVGHLAIAIASDAIAVTIPIKAAPKGDATEVATRIIKSIYEGCKQVSNARRVADGTIRARCDGTDYMVYTLPDVHKIGELSEFATECAWVPKLLKVSC